MGQLTKEQINFYKYELVRLSGEFNMIMEAGKACKKAHLTMGEYSNILKRYSIIKGGILKNYTMDEFFKIAKKEA